MTRPQLTVPCHRDIPGHLAAMRKADDVAQICGQDRGVLVLQLVDRQLQVLRLQLAHEEATAKHAPPCHSIAQVRRKTPRAGDYAFPVDPRHLACSGAWRRGLARLLDVDQPVPRPAVLVDSQQDGITPLPERAASFDPLRRIHDADGGFARHFVKTRHQCKHLVLAHKMFQFAPLFS